ncbi:GIY-YIG nuclease family protein [Streptomyces xanthophaeus]
MQTAPHTREFNPSAATRDLALATETPGLAPSTALYRFYDAALGLLYVGITGQPAERWAKHRRSAAWWTEAAYVAVEILPTEWQALDAERAAIRSESPRFNKRSQRGGR